jgi:hypothetical protein
VAKWAENLVGRSLPGRVKDAADSVLRGKA